MGTNAEQIVAKLTASELDYLEDTFRVDLRDPDGVKAFEDLHETRGRIRAVEERAIRKRREQNGERPTCSFCGETPEVVGMLCQSSMGPYICGACAQAVVERLRAKAQPETES